MSQTEEIAGDLLYGARAIAAYMLGDDDESARRKIYHLANSDALPLFRMGAVICGRRSTLSAWVAQQENAPRRRLRRKS
jgi:hypothetical protein